MRSIAVVCIIVLTAISSPAGGEQPIEALQKGVREGLQILNDPRFEDATLKDAQQLKLRMLLERLFDFREFSRQVLASNWENFSASQREEFVRVFTEFLGKFYMGQLQEKYRDETLIYVKQKLISPLRALVNVKVVWKGRKIPVGLHMIKRRGLWKVYDIQVLGISAVRNYRAQFKWLLSRETPVQLIDRIKEKIEEIEGNRLKGGSN